MKNSIAENHLSKHGRYGDTEMYKTSLSGPGKGKLWHVNKEEKTLMSRYGIKGEKLVDAIGSGTINPVTGKEEKFAMAIMAGTAVLGLANQMWGQHKENKQAGVSSRYQSKMLGEKASDLNSLIDNLPELKNAQENVALGGFEMGSEKLGTAFTKAMDTLETKAGQTNLKTSAGIEKVRIQSTDTINTAIEAQEIGLRKSFAEIGSDYEASLSKYNSELKQVNLQKDLYSRQATELGA